MTVTPGRRERRKRQTRKALADAAVKLFQARGYDGVTVAQIAEVADVSIATLFKYVPDGKPAVMFDDGVERRDALVAAVRDRPQGTSALAALHIFMAGRGVFATDLPPDLARRLELIMSTPALADYQRKLWLKAEDALANALATDIGRDSPDPATRALARYVLELPDLAARDPAPQRALDAIFRRLETGWGDI